jgi:hypothetical protein
MKRTSGYVWVTAGFFALGLGLGLGAPPGADAVKPAPSTQQLERYASLIVEGEVISATYKGFRASGNRQFTYYHSRIKVRRVLKGTLKPGAVIKVPWHSIAWIGSGRQPPGHYKYAHLWPCERVRVYLSGKPGAWSLASWAGKRTLRHPRRLRLPHARQRTVRCVKGRVR